MKILLLLLKNNLIQLCRLNQLRYADNQKRRNTIYLYIFVGTILIGGLVYLSYSLNIVFSLSWTLDEIIINLILPVILICMILNVFISIFWGSGLLLSDTNIDNLLAFPVPLMVLIISKLSILYLVQAVLDMTLLFPMAVLFGLTADMKISYYPVMAGVVLLFPIIPGLLGTIVGTKVHHILKSSSALVTRLKTIGAVLILFAFMTFMFCKFPDIVAGDTGFNFSISAISIPGSRYVHLPAILSALIGTLSTCGTCYLLLKYFSNSLLLGGYIVCGIILLLISICRRVYFGIP